MYNTDYKITNDLRKVKQNIATKYKNLPFDKGLPLIRKEMNALADKYNTSNVEMWKLLMDVWSSDLKDI